MYYRLSTTEADIISLLRVHLFSSGSRVIRYEKYVVIIQKVIKVCHGTLDEQSVESNCNTDRSRPCA
jgi:hypothetical protein